MDMAMVIGLLSTGVSVVIGALIAVVIARKASTDLSNAANDLKQETAEVRRLTALTLRGLEEAGIVTLVRDAEGNITGIHIRGSARVSAQSDLKASASVAKSRGPTDT